MRRLTAVVFIGARIAVVVEVAVQEGGYTLGVSTAELFVAAQLGGLTPGVPLQIVYCYVSVVVPLH